MADELRQLQQMILNLQGRLEAAEARARPVPKITDTFSGNVNKAREWLSVMNRQWNLHGITDDASRIRIATSCLRGTALQWYNHKETQPNAPQTWEEFRLALVDRFCPLDETRTARDKLANLKQTGSVRAYAQLFSDITTSLPNLSADELLDRYVRGLRPLIRQQVELQNPTDVGSAITQSLIADGIMHDRPFARPLGPGPRAQSAPPSDPMVLGAAQTRSRLTPREREYLRANEGCFYCREINVPDHYPNCPKANSRRPMASGNEEGRPQAN
jgi:hypothetical protein